MGVYRCNSLVVALLMLMVVMSSTDVIDANCMDDVGQATSLCKKLPPTSECCNAVEKAGKTCVCNHINFNDKTTKSDDKFSLECFAFNIVWR
ncbi:hypothetical protein ZOSMA_6319G00010 [Zostera marina]|uniref:Uncharacterized protein n=1 Tax=Zostera marina TaxID=29655 RepID=A0A0K9NTK1_ZOSMR|nr:hypothetical protein ZOSMA_6319G00010 [Zostera marina]